MCKLFPSHYLQCPVVHNLQPSTQYSFVEAACTTAGCQTGGVAMSQHWIVVRIRCVCGPCVCVCVCVCCVRVVCVCMCAYVCAQVYVHTVCNMRK